LKVLDQPVEPTISSNQSIPGLSDHFNVLILDHEHYLRIVCPQRTCGMVSGETSIGH
jgi:hypothetical protein